MPTKLLLLSELAEETAKQLTSSLANIKEKIDSLIIWISFCFSLLTVLNSIMMIFGLDTPKQGVFAYVQILIQTLI